MMADDVISAPCSPHPSSTESGSRRWSNSQSRRSRWRSRLLYLSQKLNPITHSSPIVSVATAAAAVQAFLREEGEHDTQSATPQRPRSRKQLADYYQRFITTNSETHFHSLTLTSGSWNASFLPLLLRNDIFYRISNKVTVKTGKSAFT